MRMEQLVWITIPAISTLLYTLLFITRRRGYGPVARWFTAFLGAGLLWSLGSMLLHANPGLIPPIWLGRLSAFGTIAMPWLLFGFICELLSVRRQQTWFALTIMTWVAVSLLNFTDLVVYETRVQDGLVINHFGWGVALIAAHWFLYFFASAYLLLRELSRAHDTAFRNRLRYLLTVMGLLLLGNLTNATSLAAYPIDLLLAALAAALISLSLSRYQFLEVRQALRRLFGLVIIAVLYTIVIATALYLLASLDQSLVLPVSFLAAGVTALLVFAYQPMRQGVGGFIDRVFFPQRYTLHTLIYAVSRVGNQLRSPTELGRDLLEELAKALRFHCASLLLKDDAGSGFRCIAHLNIAIQDDSIRIHADSPLIRELADRRCAMHVDELHEMPRLDALWIEEWRALDALRAEVLVPILVEKDIIGLFVLSARLTREPYTREELQSTLPLLANQVSISLANSMLYTQEQSRANQLAAANAELRQAETRIQASLREKEALLKEIHHRVKNNLQIISSLLDLQADQIHAPEAVHAFQDSRNRIRAMALIHEKLYRSNDLALINAGEYVHQLAHDLFDTYNPRSGLVTLEVYADNMALNIDTAIPCGLIINELVTNALVHAFPRRWEANNTLGQLRVCLVRSGSPDPREMAEAPAASSQADHRRTPLTLEVWDNGIGLPPDFDIHSAPTLGLQLVMILTRQLKGTIDIEREPGSKFIIRFAAPVS